MASSITVDTTDDTFPLTRSLFWDTNVALWDWERNAPFIVERVLQRGTVEDFKTIVAHYGRERLREIIKQLRYLDNKALHFSAVYFHIPLNEMRCYNIRQSTPIHWTY